MINNIENPYSNYGSIVSGGRFIGRQQDLKAIESCCIRPQEPGNMAIIGDHRIGKSSLVYQAIINNNKDKLLAKKCIPIYFSISNYDEANAFFRALITSTRDELEEINWYNDAIELSALKALKNDKGLVDSFSTITRFFQKIRTSGFNILFILDEFDHTRKLFENNISGFQRLRELAYFPQWGVKYITLSRRSIRDIEEQTGGISNFDGILKKHYLGPFDDHDMEQYFFKISSIGFPLDSEMKEQFLFFAGGHPYLLDVLGYEVVEQFREGKRIDIGNIANYLLQSFIDQYDRMVSRLEEDNKFVKLIDILFGPSMDVKPFEVDMFLKFGLIKPTKEGFYKAFSEHFSTYLKVLQREGGKGHLWPLWSQTEKALRHLIAERMIHCYGPTWGLEIEKKHPKLKTLFDKCRVLQKKEEKFLGNRTSKDLLDFTYPSELFDVIFSEWKVFSEVFDKDKSYWDARRQLITKVRNPIAHNRDDNLYTYECLTAQGYYREILHLVEEYEKRSRCKSAD